jgi:hypothetical protein
MKTYKLEQLIKSKRNKISYTELMPVSRAIVSVLDISVNTDDAGNFRLNIPIEKQLE